MFIGLYVHVHIVGSFNLYGNIVTIVLFFQYFLICTHGILIYEGE